MSSDLIWTHLFRRHCYVYCVLHIPVTIVVWETLRIILSHSTLDAETKAEVEIEAQSLAILIDNQIRELPPVLPITALVHPSKPTLPHDLSMSPRSVIF